MFVYDVSNEFIFLSIFSLLHTSLSSRSSLADSNSMESLLQQSLDEATMHQYNRPEDNPEAMFG